MTDDRSLERAARSFIEPGPTRAPEAGVERALLLIQTTSQERGLRIPWRFSPMTMPARVAAAAVVGVIALGGAGFLLRQTASDAATMPAASRLILATPSTAPTDPLGQIQTYRAAVGAVCGSLARIPDPAPSAGPTAVVAFLQATIARQNEEAAGLAAIQAPDALRTEHLANIQTLKDVTALLSHEIELVQANPPKMAEAAAVDDATGSLNTLREQFATKYALPECP
jgi:hypothetical protein